MSMQERIEAIRQRMEQACARCGREPGAVRLVAVSKYFPPDDVAAAAQCGVDIFGESRIQEARQKIPLCPAGLEWHLIGHLQTNKVRDAVRLFSVIHSVDSDRLLLAIERMAEEAGVRPVVFLEVNVSGEGSKNGLAPAAVPALLEHVGQLQNVTVGGLMTIPPAVRDPELARPFFRTLRTWRDRWQELSGVPLPELSMGMSGDLEVAIEEGATLVRVGTAIFGERPRVRLSPEGSGEEGP